MNKALQYCQSLRTPDVYFNISFVIMMFMMALLPFTTFFMWPIGILLMLLWVLKGNWREKWENFKTNDGIPYGFFLLGICLIPLTGFIKSSNMAIAWRAFEGHVWFFFAPLIFLTTSPKTWKKEHFNVLLALFSAGVISYLFTLFVRGFYMTYKTGDSSYMYNYFFCYNSHHAYTALFVIFVYLLIFEYLLHYQDKLKKIQIAALYLLELFLAVGVFCLYSRAGILTFLFMQLVWTVYAIYLKRSRWKIMLGITALVFGLFTVLLVTSPRNRFTEEALSLQQRKNDNRVPDPRLIIWQAAWDGAIENLPWGVGTGDGNDVIVEKYHENGYWKDRDHSFNAHNQFLFALLTNGIPGLILVLLYFYTPLGLAIKHRDIMLLTLFLLLFLNCLVECMFDRRAGVDFFSIMIPLMLLRCKSLAMHHS